MFSFIFTYEYFLFAYPYLRNVFFNLSTKLVNFVVIRKSIPSISSTFIIHLLFKSLYLSIFASIQKLSISFIHFCTNLLKTVNHATSHFWLVLHPFHSHVCINTDLYRCNPTWTLHKVPTLRLINIECNYTSTL